MDCKISPGQDKRNEKKDHQTVPGLKPCGAGRGEEGRMGQKRATDTAEKKGDANRVNPLGGTVDKGETVTAQKKKPNKKDRHNHRTVILK